MSRADRICAYCTLTLLVLFPCNHASQVPMECPPGHYRENTNSEGCQPCENGTFMETYNRQDGCTQCTKCTGGKEEISNCNATSNRRCKCPDNYYENTDGACTKITDDLKQQQLQLSYNRTYEVCLSICNHLCATMKTSAERDAAGCTTKPEAVITATEEPMPETRDSCVQEFNKTFFIILTFFTILTFSMILMVVLYLCWKGRKGELCHRCICQRIKSKDGSNSNRKEKARNGEGKPLLDQTQGVSTAIVDLSKNAATGDPQVILVTSTDVGYASGTGPPSSTEAAIGNVVNSTVPPQGAQATSGSSAHSTGPPPSTQAQNGNPANAAAPTVPPHGSQAVSGSSAHAAGQPPSTQASFTRPANAAAPTVPSQGSHPTSGSYAHAAGPPSNTHAPVGIPANAVGSSQTTQAAATTVGQGLVSKP